jgi:hypothetical protein
LINRKKIFFQIHYFLMNPLKILPLLITVFRANRDR